MQEITPQLTSALADRYRTERHLGEGGMATVYLARDLRHDRRVAKSCRNTATYPTPTVPRA